MSLYRDKKYTIDTVYVGGGTPSLLSIQQFEQIINAIYKNFITDITEFSVECNPESITGEKLKSYKMFGVNRISLGVQSVNDSVLKILGRAHDSKKAFEAMDMVGAAFNNWNADIMLGLPCEEQDDAVNCTEAAIIRGAKHISAYSLILEENTPLKESIEKGELTIPSIDNSADTYDRVREYLDRRGISRYEISNFSFSDYECKHNLGYWQLKEYIGAGLGAHGYLNRVRYINSEEMKEYFSLISKGSMPISSARAIETEETEEEYIMLGFRTSKGLDLKEYRRLFGQDFNEKYSCALKNVRQYLDIKENSISIKPDYMGVMNGIIIEFLK